MVDGQIQKVEVRRDNDRLLPRENGGHIYLTCVTDEQATPIAPVVPAIPMRRQSQQYVTISFIGDNY